MWIVVQIEDFYYYEDKRDYFEYCTITGVKVNIPQSLIDKQDDPDAWRQKNAILVISRHDNIITRADIRVQHTGRLLDKVNNYKELEYIYEFSNPSLYIQGDEKEQFRCDNGEFVTFNEYDHICKCFDIKSPWVFSGTPKKFVNYCNYIGNIVINVQRKYKN